jgi:hypothetical protein
LLLLTIERLEAFTPREQNKVFSGDQPHKKDMIIQHFRGTRLKFHSHTADHMRRLQCITVTVIIMVVAVVIITTVITSTIPPEKAMYFHIQKNISAFQ